MKIFGVVGWKNAGKTGLMERLVAHFTQMGVAVSTVKHAHHNFDVDQPGRDSYRHRQAGAREVLLASGKRTALMQELRGEEEPSLDAQLARLGPVDLVLVEGYKRDTHPKIEAHRAETGHDLIAPGDGSVQAIASDHPIDGLSIPVFDLDDTAAIAAFILQKTGLAHREAPRETAKPGLANNCFALPQGVDWTPVDTALEQLRAALSPVVGTETLATADSLGRVLAEDHIAKRSNPPGANSAVDGYGFAHASLPAGDPVLPLVDGRSAAGAPYPGAVPAGHALRILTGALVPEGVDTVVLQEEVTLRDGNVAFREGAKPGANTRDAGEDVAAGKVALAAGHCMRAPDIALLSALGLDQVSVYRPLRVGVLSTGDEIVAPGSTDNPARTFDANRPMLLALAQSWHFQPVDLGHVPDDRETLRARLNKAAGEADVILTSGGASAGEEDHVSALLAQAGALTEWRIAVKPGRPLALGMWDGTPVFGLPGNPVAALVCALIFARPSLSALSGAGWSDPMSFTVPAAFSKSKKPGRREYLRARLDANGHAEVFKSEGSGRISGLSWATGLVELADEGRDIAPGDPVRFLPYGSFGI